MKTYQKPVMIALSLTGNEQLCGSCAEKGAAKLLYQDTDFALKLMTDFGFGDGDSVAERGDFVGVFGQESSCNVRQIIGYCKFTSSGPNQIIAWS